MPAHNVNTAALDMVVDAAQQFQKLSEALGLSPLDHEDGSLSTALSMMEKVLETADWPESVEADPDGESV